MLRQRGKASKKKEGTCVKKKARILSAVGMTAALDRDGDELKMSISQEDWEASRKFVQLSIGITMAYVEMGDPDG